MGLTIWEMTIAALSHHLQRLLLTITGYAKNNIKTINAMIRLPLHSSTAHSGSPLSGTISQYLQQLDIFHSLP